MMGIIFVLIGLLKILLLWIEHLKIY
jgi:hypothetical protein